jgi:hypothetical protein
MAKMSNDIVTYAAIYFFLSAVLSTYIHNEWEHESELARWWSCLQYAFLSPVWMLLFPLVSAARWIIRKSKKT